MMATIQRLLLFLLALNSISTFVQCTVHLGDQEVPSEDIFKIIANVKVTFNTESVPNITSPIIRISANKFFDLKTILSVDSSGNFVLNAPVDRDGVQSSASLIGPCFFSIFSLAAFCSLVSKRPRLLFLAVAISPAVLSFVKGAEELVLDVAVLYPNYYELETCSISQGQTISSCLDSPSSIDIAPSGQISILLNPSKGSKLQCNLISQLKAVNGWKFLQQKLADQSITFSFAIKVSANPIDALIALGNSTKATTGDKPIALRFSPEGVINARNGATFTSDEQIRYQTGVWYEVIIRASMASRRYTAEIGKCKREKIQLIASAQFQDGTEAVSTLSQISLWSNGTGAIEIANISWNIEPNNQTNVHSILFFDNFSSGDFSKTMNGFTWGAATNLQVIQGFSRQGNFGHCVRFNFDIVSEAVSELRFALGASYQEIWFQYYLYYPNGTETPYRGPKMRQTGSNNKFMRIWSEDSATTQPRMGGSYYATTPSGDALFGYQAGIFNDATISQIPFDAAEFQPLVNDLTRGRWIKITHRYKASNAPIGDSWNSGNGINGFWIDGVGDEITNIDCRDPDNVYGFTHGYLQGAQDRPWLGTTGRAVYMSDFSISTESLL